MHNIILNLEVSGESVADSNKLASELSRILLDSADGIEVTRIKSDQETLDIGTILVAVLSSQFTIEVIKAIAAWAMKNPTSTVSIVKDGVSKRIEVQATGLTAEQVEKCVSDVIR